MKILVFISIYFMLNIYGSLCQENSLNIASIIPTSPQTSQLNRYGEIPVGHTTGVPQIEIPIYTLSTGWIDIPISISYHASGFRPRDIPSPIGSGWVLNAGGVISRSVEVKADYEDYEKMGISSSLQIDSLKSGTKRYNYAPGNYWMDFSKYSNWEDWDTFFFNKYSATTPLIDTRSDRYYYSFLGKIGIARYNTVTEKLTPIPYDPIVIEKNNDTFLIVDTKGIKYEFTEIESTSVSGMGSYSTGWYLTKIICPGKENEPIIFSYQNGSNYSDYYSLYSQTTQIIDTRGTNIRGNVPTIGMPEAGEHTTAKSTQINYRSPLLKTIIWKNANITFDYATDRQDQRKDRLTSLTVKYGNDVVKQATFDNNAYFGADKDTYRLKLKGLTIGDLNYTNNEDAYTFKYHNETSTLPKYENKCHNDYWGYYNGTNSDWSFPNDINIDQATGNRFADAWFNHSVYSTDRKPNEVYTKYCMLKEIHYPTKGKSIFEYESNEVPNAYEFMPFYNKVGGLRLKQRVNYSDVNTITDIKTYYYEGYPTQRLNTNLFVYSIECIDSYYYLFASNPDRYGLEKIEYPIYFFVGMPLTSLSGWTGSNVFYNKVKEYKGTAPNNSQGYIEYNYAEENRNLNNECHWNIDEYPAYMYSKFSDCDKGYIKGLLENIITYNELGEIVKKDEFRYLNFPLPPIQTGVRILQNAIYPSNSTLNPASVKSFQVRLDYYNTGNVEGLRQTEYQNHFLNHIFSFNTYAFQDISLLSGITETQYQDELPTVNRMISYTYDIREGKPIIFTPSKKIYQNSKNETFTKTITFPYSDGYKNIVPYNTMINKNMLEYPITEKIEKDAIFLCQTFTNYAAIPGTSMILPNDISIKYRHDRTEEPRIFFHHYDNYGNPVYLTKDIATKTVYIWSYNGQYPVAEIQGVTYDEVLQKINVSTLAQLTSNSYNYHNSMSFDNCCPPPPSPATFTITEPTEVNLIMNFQEGISDAVANSPVNLCFSITIKKEGHVIQQFDSKNLGRTGENGVYETQATRKVLLATGSYSVELNHTLYSDPGHKSNPNYANFGYYGTCDVSFSLNRNAPTETEFAMINNLRIQLPHAQVTTYTYKPLVGMTSKTDPNGITTYYEYDSLGRLKHVKDHSGKILDQYDYHYKP